MTGGEMTGGGTIRFRFDGREYAGRPGDTLASALLAAGVRQVATSVKLGRPRGVYSAGSEEPNALVRIEEPFPEPMLPATTVELYDGLVATGLPGQGRLADRPDPARYDAVYAHCDLLIVGAGPAGLCAAAAAARVGARVIIADERPQLGGSLLGTAESVDGTPGREWAAGMLADLDASQDARVLRRTTVLGYYDDNYLVAVERRTNHLGARAPAAVARERLWRIRARRVVLATGALERFPAFANNDLPGVMLAGSVRTYVHRHGVLPGSRAVVFTGNDSAYPAALEAAEAGIEIAAIVDPRQQSDSVWVRRCAERGIETIIGTVSAAEGDGSVASVAVGARAISADLLLVSDGWTPVVHLFSQSGGTLRYDEEIGAPVPDEARQATLAIGAARGVFTLAGCLRDGVAAARRVLGDLGMAVPGSVVPPHAEPEPPASPARHIRLVPSVGGDYSRHFVDLQRDVTVADVMRATGAGLRSVEHVKRYTTVGTAHDQGRTSGLLTSAVVARSLDADVASIGITSYRAPYAPVSFAALAGRDRGHLHDPIRVTAMHDWHAAHGAVFEDVGQWKRPRYYPVRGEDMAAAVLRECRSARTEVAMQDVSTLGRIDVVGPDAGKFLDRLYTGTMSTLRPGSIRYGVMCRPDGMVFDDGTVTRLAPGHFHVTTTTGNAAAVLDWMEEWLQTEWPGLRVHCTSVTEQWATVALAGPRSREVLAGLSPELAVDNASFPFMTWRAAEVAGIPARVCRISFSGELAYEISVTSWDGLALWQAVLAAGEPLGITTYGTETMHVLRAEKGYPIVGQDTDGSVTPQDLGMDWAISKTKADFLGKRSFSRADTARQDRKQLVALLPEDTGRLLPEGLHLIATDRIPEPPVPYVGHVTSSYRSAALGRTFALALISRGRARMGERLFAPIGAELVPVTVAHHVLYDPEGARRDG